jgi:hypothetical protein
MSHLDDELLADAALGVDDPPTTAWQHLAHCDECSRAVTDLRRTAALVARSDASVLTPSGWQAPPPHVWDRIAATTSPDAAVPMAGRARRTSATTSRTAARRIWPWAAGMAAAGLAIGLLTGRSLWSETAPAPATVAQVQLDTLDTRQRLGEALVLRTDSGVDLQVATASALDPGDGYLEVWLINSDGKRMVSVGILDAESRTFPISQDLLDEGYVVVDVSREAFDDRPEHSGDSLARGTLPA